MSASKNIYITIKCGIFKLGFQNESLSGLKLF